MWPNFLTEIENHIPSHFHVEMILLEYGNTVMILSFRTDIPGQTVQILISS